MKLGFFFGAGAEVGYGLPTGGKFAIDLFRQDVSAHKQSLRQQLGQINPLTNYATEWLPEKYATQRIHAFGKNEFTNLIESSIEYRKSEIIRRLNNFDEEAEHAISQLGLTKQNVVDKFGAEMDTQYGELLYSTAVRMNPILANEVRLFGSEFYSAILSIISCKENAANLQRYAGAFLQLLVGAHGQDLVQRLNQELFEAAPDNIPIFDDVSGMFKLEFSRAGLTALELLLEKKREYDTVDGTISDLLSAISQQLLENVFTTVLDYQSLIDSHFRYLFSPKTEWAKFSKMVVFLRATREYIIKQLEDAGGLPNNGYYHDLQRCAELDIEIGAIGTANYNSLVENISRDLDFDIPAVHHLNGGVCDYYNPYKNSVISCATEEDVPTDQIHVPFILTQSGLKPLTSVDMSRRYVGLFDEYLTCDAIIVIGYGFNIDDSHINGLFRQLIEDNNKNLFWICLSTDGSAEIQKSRLVKKLRISAENRDKVNVIPVAPSERTVDDSNWLDILKLQLSQ
ncbi:MAG: hypothetical protein KJ798_08620 [Gammaproteobacteria bacterium]|nr:hypothetical protein [Gammaproteobacteria bacterium]MBU0848354.1 hypothetical protein [Gammaproteobacteria bacterium]MBU1530485.1 hypothetical protein [Gammaproteobacteria bacterium]MBU1780437.1 hypothetical protein [Gammaproteobacteria bacterium]MBU2088047.1 hypothetical protein [Gammaproteobacteria bacterium]